MQDLMSLWAEEFGKVYPHVKLEIGRGGSGGVPKALMDGTTHLGMMSRAMRVSEIAAFEQKYGFKPTELRTALDALAIFVHKDNPIQGLTLQQLDAIYSKTRRGGHKETISTWGQLGLTGDWANRPITLYGLPGVSGTQELFREIALFNGDLKDEVNPLPHPEYMVKAAEQDRYALTYGGIGYMTPNVRTVPLAKGPGQAFHQANYGEVISGKYPLSRFLYIYIVKHPKKPLAPLMREFGKFIFSREGQGTVVKAGYLPLPVSLVREERNKLE